MKPKSMHVVSMGFPRLFIPCDANGDPFLLRRRKTIEQIGVAQLLQARRGTASAARYLRMKGWSFEAAHNLLLGFPPRKQ